MNEALGLKDYELIAYFAIFAPAGTPPAAIAALNKAANAAAADKDVLARIDRAVAQAKADPKPAATDLLTDVYACYP